MFIVEIFFVTIITIYALVYWVIFQSFLSYLLLTWANKYADPSINLGYTVLQPLTAAIASSIILATGLVRKCHGSKDADKTCLYGPDFADLGAIGIVIGLYFIIYRSVYIKLLCCIVKKLIYTIYYFNIDFLF